MEHLVIVFGILETGNLWKGHLGEAELFVKYDVFPDGSYKFIEHIKNTTKNEDEKHGNTEKMYKVKSLILDCDCMAACVLSPNFKKMAANSSIQPIVIKGCDNVEDFIKKIANNYTLISEKVMKRKNGARDVDIPVLL